MDVDMLKKKRATARSAFTKTAKILKTEICKDIQADRDVLKDKISKLQMIIDELRSCDSEILDSMIKGKAAEDDLETEVIGYEEYSDEFITFNRRVKENIDNTVDRRSSVNFEELLTVLCDVESTLNNRPLTYIYDDSEELVPLTPSLFLQDIKQVGVPDLDYIDSQKLNVRVNYCNTLRQELRSRFRKEYLAQLVQKASASCQNLKVGDVILIELDNKKRVMWPMGKIVKIFSSRDGPTRVVQVKTSSGYL
ncbi:uncharacterized protein LOC118204053, partial [Stegodyphus dumicola]|uniref:uncharacterized protein LOC118204053 n=1 Tax=Stegodyphus dumicola TaxID=202533 RepID=UPI0015AFD3EE